MKIVSDWRRAGRWWSVRVSLLGSLLCAALLAAPDALLSVWHLLPLGVLPGRVVTALQLLLFVAITVARIIQQRKADDDGR